MAALKECHKADSGSVYGTKTVDGVNVACCFHIKVSSSPGNLPGDKNKGKMSSAVQKRITLKISMTKPGTSNSWLIMLCESKSMFTETDMVTVRCGISRLILR